MQARIQNFLLLTHVRVNLVRLDRNTINCSKPDYPNCLIIFLNYYSKFSDFSPYTSVLLCGTLSVFGTLAIARALSSCLLLLPYLSHRKPTLHASMLAFLRPNADNICRNLGLTVECGKK